MELTAPQHGRDAHIDGCRLTTVTVAERTAGSSAFLIQKRGTPFDTGHFVEVCPTVQLLRFSGLQMFSRFGLCPVERVFFCCVFHFAPCSQ